MNGIFRIFIVFAIIGIVCRYIARRLYGGAVSFFSGARFVPMLVLVCALVLVIVLSFVRALTPFSAGVKHILGTAGSGCMGIFMYLLLFTAVTDILLAVPRLMKLSFTANHYFNGIVMLCVLAMTFGTCVYGFVNGRQLEHVSYKIQLHEKNDISDLRIVMISDLHLGAVGSESRLEKIVDEINGRRPDVVCIAGDFFDTDFSEIRNTEAALKTIRSIRCKYGVYACLGNHDGGQTYAQMQEFLKTANVCLLNDSCTVIDNRFVLAGRLDSHAIGGYGDQKRRPFSEVLKSEDTSMPVIVLDHNPANIHEYGEETDLILCGHTHKGQVFPANLFTKMMYTVDYGYYQKDAKSPQVIVSSGVGTWGMPMRVGSDCEIVTIDFC